MSTSPPPTADLSDAHPEAPVADPIFRDFGGQSAFGGPISTVAAFEDNALVRAALEEPGEGRVLVVDGGGSMRCAMVGDKLAALARDNGWAGVIVHGCIRDSEEIGRTDVGVKALGTHPKKSVKRQTGQRDVPVRFAGVDFVPGHFVVADRDGILVSPRELTL